MNTSITSSITRGQKKQYARLGEDAVKKGIAIALKKIDDKDGMQKLLESGDEFQSAVIDVIVAKTRELSISNQYANEEVESSYGYFSGYKKPKGMTEQTNILRQLISGIGFANEELAQKPLPENSEAEGYFAIPRWESVAPTYGEAVQKVLNLIKQTRNGKFHNYRENQIGPKYLQQSEKSAKAFQKIGEEQKGYDILVVPAQFGILHRGRSVRRAREVMRAFQFGLGAFAIGIMLLTHPERLRHYDDLWIDCAGDEFAPGAGGFFSDAPLFGFYDSGVVFRAGRVGNADGYYGSASGFLPQF
mgnify:CR=1 FL=1